ncbi:MAG TPA: hypothetical protein VMG10_11615 [Gemmataceae bacterium]|nr:hypothetical protein [Gemmataceae bacterium]
MDQLIDLLLPFVLRPVQNAIKRAVDLCAPRDAEWPGKTWYRIEGENVAQTALRAVICGNSDPAGFARTAREKLLWQAAERCEREQMVTLVDLHRAGLVPGPISLQSTQACPHRAALQPGKNTISVHYHSKRYRWLVRAAEAAMTVSHTPLWRPNSDARFWRYQKGDKWVVLDLDDRRSVGVIVAFALTQPDRSLKLVGFFLGVRAEAVFFLRDGKVGIHPAGTEERVCDADAIRTDVGYTELVRAGRDARQQILEAHHPHQGWRFWQAAQPGVDLQQFRRDFWNGFLAADDAAAYWQNPPPGRGRARVKLGKFLYRAIVGGDPKARTRDFTRGLAFSLIRLPDGSRLSWGHVLTRKDPQGPVESSLRIFGPDQVRRLAARRCQVCGHHAVNVDAKEPCSRSGCCGSFVAQSIQVCVWRRQRCFGDGLIASGDIEE